MNGYASFPAAQLFLVITAASFILGLPLLIVAACCSAAWDSLKKWRAGR